jgi:hypothetical protein
LTQMYESLGDAGGMRRAAAELREEEARMELLNGGQGCGTACKNDNDDTGEDMYENTDEGEGEDHGN